MTENITNIVIAGLGGQGVLKASDILSEVVFHFGLDVKKSELHGMSQRGGSVSSEVRFGEKVLSPMVPAGEADYLVVLATDQVENNRQVLRDGGVLITPDDIDDGKLPNKRSVNVALLGVLSRYLDLKEEDWLKAVCDNLPEKLHKVHRQAFALGRKRQKL